MEANKKSNLKKVYITPFIQKVDIDNEISLILTSIPQPVRNYKDDFEENSYDNPYNVQ